MTNPQPTDIWFQSTLALEDIAEALDLQERQYFEHDSWQLISGELNLIHLTISRAQQQNPTEARIFVFEEEGLPQEMANYIAGLLKQVGINRVNIGRWVYSAADDNFEQQCFVTL